MFRRILVPLDGSSRAERAIPVAARMARASGGVVVLLQVVTLPNEFVAYVTLQPLPTQAVIDAGLAEAKKYLSTLTTSSDLASPPTEPLVRPGPAAPAILSVAQSAQADLIVLCRHGSTGMTRWAVGSVAQKLARQSPVPALILHEDGDLPTILPPQGRPVRVLVGLDGSSLAEAALAPAAHLSAALSAPAQGTLHLAHVHRLPSMYQRAK